MCSICSKGCYQQPVQNWSLQSTGFLLDFTTPLLLWELILYCMHDYYKCEICLWIPGQLSSSCYHTFDWQVLQVRINRVDMILFQRVRDMMTAFWTLYWTLNLKLTDNSSGNLCYEKRASEVISYLVVINQYLDWRFLTDLLENCFIYIV